MDRSADPLIVSLSLLGLTGAAEIAKIHPIWSVGAFLPSRPYTLPFKTFIIDIYTDYTAIWIQ